MGENVEEALANPAWRCPVCRDICNCSGVGCQRARVRRRSSDLVPRSLRRSKLLFALPPQPARSRAQRPRPPRAQRAQHAPLVHLALHHL